MVVELPFAGTDWLVREILKEAGDAAVLEPEDAREAVREAAGHLEAQLGGRRSKTGAAKSGASKGRSGKGRGKGTGGARRRPRVRAAA